MRQIPVESPLYEHLEHFRALGYGVGGLEVRPIRVADFVAAVEQIGSEARERPLSGSDQERLQALQDAADEYNEALRRTRQETTGADTTSTAAPPSFWSFGGALQFFGQATDLDSLPDLDRRPRRDPFFFMFVDIELPKGLYAQWRFYQDYSALTPTPGGKNWVDNLPPNLRDTLTDGSARNDLGRARLRQSLVQRRAWPA